MSAVDQAVVEIDQALAILIPQYEGLKDFQRLNLQPETAQAVQVALTLFDRRVGMLQTIKDLSARLIADGHPTLDIQQVTAAVYADLQENQTTITAALTLFASDPAARLELSAHAPEAK